MPSSPIAEFERQLIELRPCYERCVIINVHTEAVTALAAYSARRYGAETILVVNCDPTPGSRGEIEALASSVRADVIEAPVRPHGKMLDTIFMNLSDERVLLLDSDAELRSHVLDRMRGELRPPDVYGSGWIFRAAWIPGVLGVQSRPSVRTGWYLERPWIPCVLLKRERIAQAIRSGATFKKKIIPNDIPIPGIAHVVFLRFGVPGLRRLRFAGLRWMRREYDGVRPNYCYADTGALIHRWMVGRGMSFAGPEALQPDMEADVAHYHGVTRARLKTSRASAHSYQGAEASARSRLRDSYGVGPGP